MIFKFSSASHFRCNVGHASTCNTVGQTAGFFLGYVMFLALESPYFCNKYIRLEPSDVGLVTLAGFLWFWGWIFVFTTTLVAIMKHEAPEHDVKIGQTKGMRDIVTAYSQLYTIVKLPAVRTLALVLFTAKVSNSLSSHLCFSSCVILTQHNFRFISIYFDFKWPG